MQKMKISTRLALGFLVVIMLSILLAGIGVFSIVSIKDNNTYLLEHSIKQNLILKDVMLQFTLMRYRVANYAMEFENPDIITKTLTPQFQGAYSAFLSGVDAYLEISEDSTVITLETKQSNRDNADKLNSLVTQQFVPVAESVRALALAGDADGATKTLRDAISLAGEINGLIGEMTADIEKLVDERTASINEFADNRALFQIYITIFSVVFAIGLALYITRAISSQVRWYQNILDYIPMPLSVTDMQRRTMFINKPVEDFLQIKRGDVLGTQCSVVWKAGICNTENCGIECLQRNQPTTFFSQGGMDFRVDSNYLHDKSGKKTGHIEIVQDLTSMMKAQREEAELVKNIEDISDAFIASARQITDGSQVLAQNSNEQSSAVGALSQSLADITSKTKSSADMAGKAAGLASTIKTNAEKGSRQMDEMINAVKEINEASQSIGNVIKTIDDIAFQTNILALNAAVEAARAGAAGKGFAVVAEEVRNLASKSAEAAKNTAGLIENSMEKSGLGTRIAGETAESLGEIVSGINESSQLIFAIAKSSEEQSNAIMQINNGIETVTQIIQQTSAAAEESAAASEEMSSQAGHLEKLINKHQSRLQG